MPVFRKQRRSVRKTCSKASGGGYYFDVNQPAIAGRPEVSGYNDFAPPLFVGELLDGRNENLASLTGSKGLGETVSTMGVPSALSGGSRKDMKTDLSLDEKIHHVRLYIATNGKHKLPTLIQKEMDAISS